LSDVALDQLRIDRSASEPDAPRKLWWILGAVLLLAAVAAVIALVSGRGAKVAVPAAAAAAVSVSNVPLAVPASSLEAAGYVVANKQATVAAKVTGRLTEVLFEEGQHVEKGQVLAKLDDTNAVAELRQAQARVDLALTTLAGKRSLSLIGERQLERQQSLQSGGWVTKAVVDGAAATTEGQHADIKVAEGELAVANATLEVARRNLDDTIVRAPFAGVIVVKAAQQGEIISPISAGGGFTRTGICTIVAMDSLEVSVDVSENVINRVSAGQPATVTLNAYKDWAIPAQVIAVVPTADRTKATVGVRIAFKERDARILPQMGVNVRFLDASAPAAAHSAEPSPSSVRASSS